MKDLAHKEVPRRREIRKELLKRNTPEVRAELRKALDNEYLGTRIAAWEALSELKNSGDQNSGDFNDILVDYDPWAVKTPKDDNLEPED